MKLTRVEIKHFRSFVNTDTVPQACIDIGDGLNLLVGRNNCGKSNLLKGIALALEGSGGANFDWARDVPAQLPWAYPVITLSFSLNPSKSVERTLLKYLSTYEQSAGTTRTYAKDRELHLRVKYTKSGRDEFVIARGAGNRRGDSRELEKCLSQFRRCIRFIYLRSGENLREFLSGTFHELLHNVLRENLKAQMNQAESRRKKYIDGLTKDLLKQLEDHVTEQLSDVMNEIEDVSISPHTPELSEALSNALITIKDSAETGILEKGTGVRGALLIALLTYIAEHSRRSLVLAVEEPESFLHPEAQEELREDLKRLASRNDVSLLVTTHSPFLLDRSPSTRIIPIWKDPDGISRIDHSIKGDQSHTSAVKSLFGESLIPAVLERISPLKMKSKAVLFLEGYTDLRYIELALSISGSERLLDELELRQDGGANKTALQALLLRQLVGDDVPIGALFDFDEPGKTAVKMLNRFNWSKKYVKTYREWMDVDPQNVPVEAEDMFRQQFLVRFERKYGQKILAEKVKYLDGTFHYGFTEVGKKMFLKYVEDEAKPRDVRTWIGILQSWRRQLGLDS